MNDQEGYIASHQQGEKNGDTTEMERQVLRGLGKHAKARLDTSTSCTKFLFATYIYMAMLSYKNEAPAIYCSHTLSLTQTLSITFLVLIPSDTLPFQNSVADLNVVTVLPQQFYVESSTHAVHQICEACKTTHKRQAKKCGV